MSPGPDGRAYLSCFAHIHGDRVPLDGIQEEVLREELESLHEQGLRHCRVAAASVVDLAAASSRATLEAFPHDRVDAIVFCTDTSPEVSPTSEVWDLLLELGIPRTPVTFVSGSGCGNLGPALSVARAMVLLDGLSSVLVVTSDRVPAGTRYLANGQTVMSDGAASCVVSAEPSEAGFEIRALASSVRADIGTVAARPILVARATAQAIRQTVRQAIEPLSLTLQDFRYLLTGNYGRTPREFLATSVGMPVAQVYCPELEQCGHCFAADVLASLGSLLRTGEVDDGDHLLLLTMSPRSWSVAVVRCTWPGGPGHTSEG